MTSIAPRIDSPTLMTPNLETWGSPRASRCNIHATCCEKSPERRQDQDVWRFSDFRSTKPKHSTLFDRFVLGLTPACPLAYIVELVLYQLS